jgi:hypothetical protein
MNSATGQQAPLDATKVKKSAMIANVLLCAVMAPTTWSLANSVTPKLRQLAVGLNNIATIIVDVSLGAATVSLILDEARHVIWQPIQSDARKDLPALTVCAR